MTLVLNPNTKIQRILQLKLFQAISTPLNQFFFFSATLVFEIGTAGAAEGRQGERKEEKENRQSLTKPDHCHPKLSPGGSWWSWEAKQNVSRMDQKKWLH
jgi:hypothetical protein